MQYMKRTAILYALESTPGTVTDLSATAGDTAILVANMSINPIVAQNVERELVVGRFGNFEQLSGDHYVEIEFEVELAGAGSVDGEPLYGKILQCCNMSYTKNKGCNVVYGLQSGVQKTGTLFYYINGLVHKVKYVRGTVSFLANIGTRPTMKFKMTGLDSIIELGDIPDTFSTNFGSWTTPLAVIDANTTTIALNSQFNGEQVIGGAYFQSQGLEVDLGNQVTFLPLIGDSTNTANSIQIVDRKSSGKISLNLSAAEAVAFLSRVKNEEIRSLSFSHGTATGNIIEFFLPYVQLINPTYKDQDGAALLSFDLRLIPSSEVNYAYFNIEKGASSSISISRLSAVNDAPKGIYTLKFTIATGAFSGTGQVITPDGTTNAANWSPNTMYQSTQSGNLGFLADINPLPSDGDYFFFINVDNIGYAKKDTSPATHADLHGLQIKGNPTIGTYQVARVTSTVTVKDPSDTLFAGTTATFDLDYKWTATTPSGFNALFASTAAVDNAAFDVYLYLLPGMLNYNPITCAYLAKINTPSVGFTAGLYRFTHTGSATTITVKDSSGTSIAGTAVAEATPDQRMKWYSTPANGFSFTYTTASGNSEHQIFVSGNGTDANNEIKFITR